MTKSGLLSSGVMGELINSSRVFLTRIGHTKLLKIHVGHLHRGASALHIVWCCSAVATRTILLPVD